MYVPEDYANYKYLVSYSDNFVVLTNTRTVSASWDNPRTIDTIVQYHFPSIFTLESTATVTSNRTYEQVEISDSFYSRADCPQLICAIFILIFFLLFIINGLTRFVRRGGVFFGN